MQAPVHFTTVATQLVVGTSFSPVLIELHPFIPSGFLTLFALQPIGYMTRKGAIDNILYSSGGMPKKNIAQICCKEVQSHQTHDATWEEPFQIDQSTVVLVSKLTGHYSASFPVPIPQARLNTLPTIPIYCTDTLYLFYNTSSFSPAFGCASPSISTLPSLYLKLPLCNLHFLPAVAHHFVSPPFQIQTNDVSCSLHCC